MTSTFGGFSEEDLKRIKSGERDIKSEQIEGIARRIEKVGFKSRRIAKKLPTLSNQISDEVYSDAFDRCKLSLKSPTSPNDAQNNITKAEIYGKENEDRITHMNENEKVTDCETLEEGRTNTIVITPDVVRGIDYTEDDLATHKVKLEELQLRQKLMEEQNKKRKEMLAKALADRTKQTEEEVQKLEKIKKELQVLDGQFSQDVAVLRKKIDQACITYSESEKYYLRIEKEFLQAKINLQKEKEKKELLTEHLCALITHNETRKAQKLETLMLELANDKNKVISEMVENINENIDVATPDEEPVIIDGVDEKTGKIVEMQI
ncbi:RAB6-interacting golgin isoform X2 [Pieris rapae]|uniref:RAB6-interacting golgin isoform X2 n=1 Tax=Pieris rapae TaxID=64459 RepID=UPI001E27B987|nr:RAB6-interacting golgin isoform X2 [Pieris rapae]